MGVIASCGHELASVYDGVSVRYRNWTCDAIEGFGRAVTYAEYCPACATELEASEDWIGSDEEEDAWMGGQDEPASPLPAPKPDGGG